MAANAPSRAANPVNVSSFDQKTWPRRGMNVSQLVIEPELYSAPMKLAAIVKVTSATSTVDNLSAVLAASLNGVGSPLNSASVGSGIVHSSGGRRCPGTPARTCSWLATQSL